MRDDPLSAPEPARPDRPSSRLLVAAAVVAVMTLAAVLRFGLVEPPMLDTVDASTRPTASLALLTYRDAERSQCLVVITPDGAVREVRCGLDGAGPLIGWDERGILMLRYLPAGERVDAIDPVTGAITTVTDVDPRDATMRWSGAWFETDRDGGTLIVRDEAGAVLWRVEAPDGYRISSSVLDPATGRFALLDSAGRLLVLAPGASEPDVWVADVGAEYGELVWEGTALAAD